MMDRMMETVPPSAGQTLVIGWSHTLTAFATGMGLGALLALAVVAAIV